MSQEEFARYADKLKTNVYGSLKGDIRLTLLLNDLKDYCPPFSTHTLSVLDVGGGGGQFAKICCDYGHQVTFCEKSPRMLEQASDFLKSEIKTGNVELVSGDFLEDDFSNQKKFDLVLFHGSAEWMSDLQEAIKKGARLLKTSGYMSLLLFNKDKLLLKQGINGHLVREAKSKKKKLFPPGAQSTTETIELLNALDGIIVAQSGIRVFHGFFRQVDKSYLSQDQWLEQERCYYRKPPFSSLGEHTHFIWKKMVGPLTGKTDFC